MNYQPDFNSHTILQAKKRRFIRTAFIITGCLLVFYVGFYFIQASMGNEVTIDHTKSGWGKVASIFPFGKDKETDPDYVMPSEEKDRLDILVMGIRGAEDVADGGNLTDTILLFSYDKKTKKSSLVSIPRDLYVKISGDKKDKINAAYPTLGLNGTKKLFSRVTGVYIDNIVVFDFDAFTKIIDTLGGIDITLDQPFEEKQQWGYPFSLPAGPNHLNSEQALYYSRSRYSSSDFDRARRQQQVIFAIRQKVMALDILSDPGKTLEVLNIIRKHLVTDINLLDTRTYVQLAQNLNTASIKRHVITTMDLLYETHINGAYVLLPQGDNFDRLKAYFTGILLDPTPTPSPVRTP
jgi:LCP family protein required for cell wall assembly